MINMPYLLIVWTLAHGAQQTEYSNKAACERARHVMIMAAVDKDGKSRRDFKAICVAAYETD